MSQASTGRVKTRAPGCARDHVDLPANPAAILETLNVVWPTWTHTPYPDKISRGYIPLNLQYRYIQYRIYSQLAGVDVRVAGKAGHGEGLC